MIIDGDDENEPIGLTPQASIANDSDYNVSTPKLVSRKMGGSANVSLASSINSVYSIGPNRRRIQKNDIDEPLNEANEMMLGVGITPGGGSSEDTSMDNDDEGTTEEDEGNETGEENMNDDDDMVIEIDTPN